MKYEPRMKFGKVLLANVVFGVLKRGLKTCYRLDSKVRDIIKDLPDGYVFTLRILPFKPYFSLKKTGDKLVNVKKDEKIDLELCFKNIEVALPVLTGRQGVEDTYKYSSIITYGNIGDTVKMVECMNIVENYLFPKVITSKILKGKYEKNVSSFRVYLGILFGV